MSSSAATAGVAVGVIDSLTNAAIGISYAHHEAHEGESFVTTVIDMSMNDGDTIVLVFKTAAGTNRVHMLLEFSTLVGGELVLWEGATWTAQSGAEMPIINRKREGSMTSSTLLADQAQAGFVAADVVHINPTGLNIGAATSIQDSVAWGIKNQSAAATSRDTDEIVLNPDTQYAAVFTAFGGSNKAHVVMDWYEHTDSNCWPPYLSTSRARPMCR